MIYYTSFEQDINNYDRLDIQINRQKYKEILKDV